VADRYYQTDCNDAILTAYDQGWCQQIVSMATGTGKTWVFSLLYEKIKSRLPGQMLVLAHTEELVDQNIKTLHEVNPTLRVDKEMAEHRADPSLADIIVASVKSLGRLNTSRIANYDISRVDKVVIDEAHHTPAETYMRVLEAFKVLESTKKLLLGCTATPQRADGIPLADIYKKMTYVYSLRQAINDGFLVKVRGYRAVTQTDISKVSISDHDFNRVELEAAIDSPERNERIVNAWLDRCEHRKTVVYSAGIQHAQNLAVAFRNRGIEAQAIWGVDVDRKTKLDWHRNTAGSVLVNDSLLIEGYDDPSISCIVLAAPTSSCVKFAQMCGRAFRLYPGKVDCIILGIDDICGSHSLVTLPMLMGMPANLDLQGHGIVEAVELIEAMQEENPNVDFTKLKLLDNITQFIEQVNLFEVRFPKEVEENSEFRWVRAIDGGFVMRVPNQKADCTGVKPGRVRIYENVLGEWEIDGRLKDGLFHGVRKSIEEAFACADQQIRQRAPASVCLVNRSAAWMTKPATAAQMKMLNRLYKGKAWPEGFTQGQASHFIDQRIGGKK
jgi:superfamily II DNA or RNA helicase